MIKTKIIRWVQDNLGVELDGDEDLKNEGIDSLSLVILVAGLEELFSIEFNEVDLDPEMLCSLDDLVNLVEKYI